MATLSALVSGLEAELLRLGYKDSTLVWYRGCWRRMQKHFAARGIEEFSLDAAMAWVDDACGFFGKEQAGTLKRTDVYLFRVAQMLGEYAAHGAVLRRYNRSVSKLDGPGAEAVARFQAHLRSAGRSASTVRTYGTFAGEFVAFTGTRGGLAACDAATIGAFVATLAGLPVQDCRAETVRGAVVPAVRVRRRPGGCRVPAGGPGGTLGQAGQDPVGVGSGRGGQDRRGDRPGQPVREAGLRDHPADHQARAARRGHPAAGVRRLRLAGQPAIRDAGQDRSPGAVAAAEGGRLGGDRLHPPWPAGLRLPAGVRAAHWRRSARSPTRIICIRSWSSTPGWRTCG